MAFFRDREPQSAGQLTTEIAPYLAMTIELEADQRLDTMALDLVMVGRDLLTSNDHYQATSAYLNLARNRAVVATEVYGQLSKQSPQEIKKHYSGNDTVRDFLVQEFQTAQHNLEAADRISAEPSTAAAFTRSNELKRQLAQSRWPAYGALPPSFIHGAINGMNNLYGVVSSQVTKTLTSQTLPNNFRYKLQQQVEPLLAQVEGCRTSIDRVSSGLPTGLASESALNSAYERTREAVELLDTVALWVSMPRLFDETFTLRNPLDETRPPEKKFNASSLGLGATAMKAATPPAPQPDRPQHAFDPSIFDAPTPPTAPQQSPQPTPKHFEVGDLDSPPTPPTSDKPEMPPKRSFNPDDLNASAPQPKPQSQPKRQFNPDDLG